MTSVRSNNISLKYQRFTTLDSKDIGIRKTEFVQGLNSFVKNLFNGTYLYQKVMCHEFILKVFVLILESKTKNKNEILFFVVNFLFLKKQFLLFLHKSKIDSFYIQ